MARDARRETSLRLACLHSRALYPIFERLAFFKFEFLANQCEIVAAHLSLKLKIL